MKQKKYTKRALCMSLLSMLLCCSMLVGTTFAWFTDSVTSGRNKIMAGNLDVELDYAPASAAADGTISEDEWNPVDPDVSLFNDDALWEPGHTEYVYLRVRNAGTLALEYEVAANVYGDALCNPEKEYTSMQSDSAGKHTKYKLSQYLVFRSIDGTDKVESRDSLWISDPDAERAAMGTTVSLYDTQTLLPGNSNAFTLAVYMPTQVGNEANQLTSARTEEGAPEVYLGITVIATQTPHETDSFDKHYDDDAFVSRCDLNGHDFGDDDSCIYCGAPNPFKNNHTDSTGSYVITGLDFDVTDLNIPGTIHGMKVEIGEGAFKDNEVIESVVLGEGITSIGNSAFKNCTFLKTLTLSESVTEIGSEAFWNCGLESVNLSSVEKLGNYAFTNSEIRSLKIGARLKSFGSNAFNGCDKLQSVEFEAGCAITSIPDSTFNGCASLTDIELPETVTSIGSSAFQACGSLTSIDLDNIKTIGTNAFYDSGLTSVNLPNITSIGTNAFRNDYGNIGDHSVESRLTTVTLGLKENPSTSITIGEGAFYGCKVLTDISIYSTGIKLNKWCFNECSSLENITFSGTSDVWKSAFSGLASWHFEAKENTVIHCSDGNLNWNGDPVE